MELTSGYARSGSLLAYQELRDDRSAFYISRLPLGAHTLRYRLRAEIPGRFSALPSRLGGMYAPELKGNSAEAKLGVE